MGKWLTVEEKLNAENEVKLINRYIKLLKQEINNLKYRKERLKTHIEHKKYSEHNGLYGINGLCYKLYGKKASEMTEKERREYDAIAKLLRERKKLEDK